MLKKKLKVQQAQQAQSNDSCKQVNKFSLIRSKLTTKILLLVLFIMLFGSLSFAWFTGIHITFSPGLDLSVLASLKNNVDVTGYSFNENYDEADENSNYLSDVTFKTAVEMDETGDADSKNLFAGDYFEPGAINKLNRADYPTLNDYNQAVNQVIDANTNTKYIKVTNRSDMDIAVRSLFTLADVNGNINDLSGFWYLITDVTTDVYESEGIDIIGKLSTYAEENKASRSNDFNELNLASNVFEKALKKIKLGVIEEAENKEEGNTRIFRIDYGLCESALRSSGSYYFGKKVLMNMFIYYGQTNAPDDEETEVQTTIREVDSAEKLLSTLSNLKEAFNGDTIKFTADITIDGPLTISRPFNFDLNGHRLTINGGDLTFSYNSSTPVNIDLTRKGSIYIIGKRAASSAQTSYDGSLIINTPNSPITFEGDNANASGVENFDLRLDGVGSIVNYSKNGNGGLYYNNMYTVQYTYDQFNNYSLIPTETVITLDEAASVTVGPLVNIDLITSNEITSCFITNYGNVGYIYLPSVNIPVNVVKDNLYLYIYNNGKIGDYNGNIPKTWDVQLPPMARPATTQVIKDKQSNNFTIGGSNAFRDTDITDLTDASTYIVPIANEDNAYTVYLFPTTPKIDNSKLKYVFYDYFNNNEANLAGIKKLVIVGTKGVTIDQEDIKFLMKKNAENTDYIFTYLEHLDMSSVSVETSNYSVAGERLNRIPNNAFKGKTSLTTVILPEDVVYIGYSAFEGTSLQKITIPSNVQSIGTSAFANVIDVTVKSFYPVANNKFLVAFPSHAYFFVDSTMVDTYKNHFGTNYGGVDYSKHVYRYAEHIDNNFYIRVVSELNSQLEIVAYTGDIYGTSVTPTTLEYLGRSYSVTGIGRDAYINMTNNQSINLHLSVGDAVQYIGQGAFKGLNCIASANTKLATQIDKQAFYGCDYLKTLTVDGSAVIGEEAFANCTRLSNVSLSRCIEIGSKAFSGDKSITNLSIPKVHTIGSEAFLGCYSFESVVFGELAVIGEATFKDCRNLATVVFSSITKEIGDNCFENCQALTSIASTTAGLEQYYLKLDYLEKIGNNAFKNCVGFKYIKAPCLKSIGEYAFNGCTSLHYIEANSLSTISERAFSDLTNLSLISINNVETIGDYAFYNTGIQYVDIPYAKTIGISAFEDCKNISEITFGTPTKIDNRAFYGVKPTYIDVSNFVYKTDLSVPDDPDVETFAFGANNDWHRFAASVKYYFKSGKTLESEIQERKNYLYKVLETSYYKEYDSEYEYYRVDYRDNLQIDYIFEKDQFLGDWLIKSEDDYLIKNMYLYNIKVNETYVDDVLTYEGEILSYHGKPIIGNAVIPTQVYYPNGIPQEDFDNKNSTYYNGTFNVMINGVSKAIPVTKIGHYAYENVDMTGNEVSATITGDNYSHITFANTVKEVEEGAFRYSKLDFVDLNKVEKVGKDSFRNTSDLRYVDLGNCVEIGDYAFSSYSGTQSLWEMYKQYGHSFSVSTFTPTVITKIKFRHVDKIGECAFFYNYLDNKTFLILDFSENAPGLDDSYNLGFGLNKRYNAPSDFHEIWRGYNSTLYYYYANSYQVEYNDINILAPYIDLEQNIVRNAYLQMIDSNHLFFDYGYVYKPDYKVNDVEVGMFWLQPGNINDPSSGFIITKSLIRNYGNDLSLEGLEVTNAETKRYMYTIPSSLNGQNIYNTKTNSYMAADQTYPSKIGAQSFKNSTVQKDFIVDISIGEGITTIPNNAFRFAQFKNVYLNSVTTLESSSFAYSSAQIIYAFNLETIGSDAFYDSAVTIIDLRQNKRFNEETGEMETIYVTFNSGFIYYSNIKAIYVNDSDLDTYIENTKGTQTTTGYELYVYIKALGTHIGEIKLKYNSSYDLESILSTYVSDSNNESIEWVIENDLDNKFSVVEGKVTVNDNPALDDGTKYYEGNCDVYCIRHIAGQADQVLGKFHFIITDDTNSVEYYNISKSEIINKNGAGTDFNGYRVISYNGSIGDGIFDVSDEFNNFMTSHISSSDKSRFAIFNHTNPEDGKFVLFEISVGSYMNMTIANQISSYLYTDKYITKIGDYAFYSIPFNEVWLESVTVIGRRAFCNNRSNNAFTLLVMPKIETVEYQAFYQNLSLATVVIGDCGQSKLKSIGYYGFALCTSVSKFGIINKNLTEPEKNSYYVMRNYVGRFDALSTTYNPTKWVKEITEYTDEHEVTTYTYKYYDLTSNPNYGFIFLPNTTTSISERAFYQMNQIDEVRYPNTPDVTSVPYRAFENCKKLHYVRLGKYVTSIGQEAFAYCENLISTPYPDLTFDNLDDLDYSLTYGYSYTSPHNINSSYRTDGIDLTFIKTIGTGSFRNCYQLNNLYLDSIESIGTEAFMECSSLRYISFELNVPREGLSSITFGSRWNYSTHELKRYYVTERNKAYFTGATYIYVRQKELLEYGSTSDFVLNYITNPLNTSEILGIKLVCYNGDQMIQIPKTLNINGNDYSVLSIGKYAFHGYPYNENVDTLILPGTVTTVESYAFDGTMFSHYEEEPNTNSSVDYGSYVFNGNTKLIDAKFTRMNSGGTHFFNNCGSLTEMNLQENYVNNVYAAPILNDDFFTGSPSKAKCSIMTDMNYLFTSAAYLGRLFEESEEVDVDNLYSVKIDASNNVTILSYIGNDYIGVDGDYEIPRTLKLKDRGDTLYTVTKIADGAFRDKDVVQRTNLIIGDNITSIGIRAFNSTNFGSITFTGNVHDVTIGEYAFANMQLLVNADISKLNNIDNANYLFYQDILLQNVTINPAFTKIPDYCFAECGNLSFLQIGNALTTIGNHAFENCGSLKVIQLNENVREKTFNLGHVKTVGDYAFAGCISLNTLIAFDARSLGEYCFKGCTTLNYPNLDNTLDFIGTGAFYQCTSLISAKAYTTYIPDYCYYGCTSITSVDVTGARSIGARAFYQCTGIQYLDLLNLMIVGDYAFYQCTNLEVVEMNYVTQIGSYAFYNCAFSGEFVIPAATSIGSYAFANNTQLTKVTFNGTKTFGSRLFYNDVLITEFDFTNNYNDDLSAIKPTSSGDVFTGVNDTFFIYVPGEVLSYYETAFSSWKHRIFERGKVISDNPDYMVKDVVGGYEIVRYLGSGLSGNYKVPEVINGTPIVSIGRYAFYNSLSTSRNVNSVNLGTNVTKVGNYAFYDFDFATLAMPSVETIGTYAFANNEKLGYLSLENCKQIGQYAFYKNTSLQLIRLYDTLTNIEMRAFYDCEDLRSVYFANTSNLNNLTVYNYGNNKGYEIFGTLSKTDVIIRVPTDYVSNYMTKLSYYKDRIKAGELDSADFSYRTIREGNEDVIEIIAYEGQATKITIKSIIDGKRVVRILNNAFENSLNLEIVEIPDTLKAISSHAFMGNSTIKAVNVYSDDTSKINLPSLFSDNKIYFVSYDGVLFLLGDINQGATTTQRATTLVYYPVAKEDKSYDFKTQGSTAALDYVNMIYENAFYGNSYLEDLLIPYSVRSIGENAFAYCPSLRYAEFESPQGGSMNCPVLYGTNIFTNCDSELRIIVSNATYYNSFKNDEYFSYYQDKLYSSRS